MGYVSLIYRVEEGFTETEINPITSQKYSDDWVAFCLTTSDQYQIMVGGGSNSIYTVRISKNYQQWKMSLMDFIQFQESCNKNILLSVSNEDFEEAKSAYNNYCFNDSFLRDYEPKVLVHSTTLSGWQYIKKDGYLKSWNILKGERESWEDSPIGSQLGDPTDFSDYIMFSGGAVAGEIVVLSKQNGKIIMDQDMRYIPGVRLYFDAKKIAEDKLLVRDGCHLKVKDKLLLEPYLIWVADWKTIELESEFSTPAEFTVKANNRFNEIFGEKVITSF